MFEALSDSAREGEPTSVHRLARALGWFSIALGAAELIAPGRIARTLGLEGREGLLRAYGGREIAAGIGALSVAARPAMWSRVAGDLLDLGTLAIGRRDGDGDQRRYAGYAIAAVVGVTLIDLVVAGALAREERGRGRQDRAAGGRPRERSRPPEVIPVFQ